MKIGKGFLEVAFLICAVLIMGMIDLACADNAEVLPKGVSRISMEGKFYLPITERFDKHGNVEDVATDFNTTLDSTIFSGLSQIESFFGMPPGSANIGRSVVSFKYDFKIVDLSFYHGITDKLTVGVFIPYWFGKNTVKARLNTSHATVGKNAELDALVPLGVPGTVPLTKNDVQNLLGKGLDINGDGTIDIPGYRFERFGTWSYDGLGDIEGGFRYQYVKTDNWRLAFTGGVRFPTGKMDDPDNLVDYGFGNGAYAALFRLNNDYTGIKNVVLDATIRYDHYFSNTRSLRIPEAVHEPITANKEDVSRKTGDVTELEASANYEFLKGFNASVLYKYGFAQKDDVKGKNGHVQSLEDETNYTEHVFIGGLSYSTLPLFLEKKFPLPLTAHLDYRNRFAGSNNIFKSQYILLGVDVFF
jgi:hypothetical protein